MSVHRYTDSTGRVRHRVRWREGGANRQRTFADLGPAEAFDRAVRVARAGAERDRLSDGTMTLREYVAGHWWPRAAQELAATTLLTWPEAIERWLLPTLGPVRLCDLSLARVRNARAGWCRAGASNNRANALVTILSAILGAAAKDGLIQGNPCRDVGRLSHLVSRPQVLSPLTIERLRARMSPRGALVVSLLAYAGLRPQEMRALTWGSFGAVLVVDRAYAAGELTTTKTRRRGTVPVCAPLAEDLAGARPPGAPEGHLVVHDGQCGYLDLNRWRRREWHPAGAELDPPLRAVPYDLRHSYASLLIHEGRPITYVAQAMRHSRPTTTLTHYAHLYAAAELAPGVSMEDAIRAARAQVAQEPLDEPGRDARAAA